MSSHILKVINGYRVTVPKEFREQEALDVGDHVEVQFLRKVGSSKET